MTDNQKKLIANEAVKNWHSSVYSSDYNNESHFELITKCGIGECYHWSNLPFVIKAQIDHIYNTYKQGWDGYNAAPVTKQSKETAYKIVEWLSKNEFCDINPVPTANGGFSFDWFLDWEGDRTILTIECDNDKIYWAWSNKSQTNMNNGYGLDDKIVQFYKSMNS